MYIPILLRFFHKSDLTQLKAASRFIGIWALTVLSLLAACVPTSIETQVNEVEPTSLSASPTIAVLPTRTATPLPSATPVPTQAQSPTPAETVIKDVPYAVSLQSDVEDQALDIYLPLNEPTGQVVIFLHGFGNRKGLYSLISEALAEQGAMVFTVDWPTMTTSTARQDNGTGFREEYEVMACAVRFARSAASQYGIEPSQVILAGHSAGARRGTWFALSGGTLDEAWETMAEAGGGQPERQVSCTVEDGSAQVDVLIGIAGMYLPLDFLKEEDPGLWEIVAPTAMIGRYPDLQVFLVHGSGDVDIPIEDPQAFNDLLLENGYDSELILHEGRHAVPIELVAGLIASLRGE